MHPSIPTHSSSAVSLYVHVPWCRTRCLYCDFNSHPTQAPPWERFLAALEAHLEQLRVHPFFGRPIKTLFFGGGTPSLLPVDFYQQLIPRLQALFPTEEATEVTLEANPGTVTAAQLDGLRAAGINRLSFGVQSLNPIHLETLTRIHGREQALEAVGLAQAAGFENLSIDLMFGIPGQSLAGWRDELEEALTLPLSHLSVYNLTPEEGTALARQLDRGRLFLPDEDVLVAMYQHTRARLRAAGYEPYEISNFSRGRPCLHNLQYWLGGDYLGIGPGAHSYCRDGVLPGEAQASRDSAGCRWWELRDPVAWMERCLGGEIPLDSFELLEPRQAAQELLLTQGRLMRGIDLRELEARFGRRARQAVLEGAGPGLRRGLWQLTDAQLGLTDDGVLVADALIRGLSMSLDGAL